MFSYLFFATNSVMCYGWAANNIAFNAQNRTSTEDLFSKQLESNSVNCIRMDSMTYLFCPTLNYLHEGVNFVAFKMKLSVFLSYRFCFKYIYIYIYIYICRYYFFNGCFVITSIHSIVKKYNFV
jgi:hypothetical protein